MVYLLTKSFQSYLTLQPHGPWPSCSSVLGVLQARILEWVAMPYSRGSSQPKGQTQVFCTAGGFFTFWATGEALWLWNKASCKKQQTYYYVVPFWQPEALTEHRGMTHFCSVMVGASAMMTPKAVRWLKKYGWNEGTGESIFNMVSLIKCLALVLG